MLRNYAKVNRIQATSRYYSSHKEILFGESGRQALAKGVDILANAVAATLGPKGRNVLIGKFLWYFIFYITTSFD